MFALLLLPDHLSVGVVRDPATLSVQPGPAAVTLDALLAVPHLLPTHSTAPVTAQHNVKLPALKTRVGVGGNVLETVGDQGGGNHLLLVLNGLLFIMFFNSRRNTWGSPRSLVDGRHFSNLKIIPALIDSPDSHYYLA